MFYQLAFNLLRIICPRLEASIPVLDLKLLSQQRTLSETSSQDEEKDVPVIHALFTALLQVMKCVNERAQLCHCLVCFCQMMKSVGQHGFFAKKIIQHHPQEGMTPLVTTVARALASHDQNGFLLSG